MLPLKVTVTVYVNIAVPVAVPEGRVTTMSFAPTEAPAGVTAVIVVEFTTTKLVRATPFTVAPVEPVKPVPVMVIVVPPARGPLVAATEVTCNHWA